MNEKYLRGLIKDYVNACIADSHSGGGHPADIPIIERWMKQSKKKLFNYIRRNNDRKT